MKRNFLNTFDSHYGGLAQLARALHWQCRGHRFDSDILHKAAILGCFCNLIPVVHLFHLLVFTITSFAIPY